MGRMKEPLTDHVACRVEKVHSNYFTFGCYSLIRFPDGSMFLRHMSGEGFPVPLSTFEAEVCPWEELGSKDNITELIEKFYAEHF
ncbi:MAG: hypothetical protein A2Y38_00550 [Spirochaetes bacterium GWB1_59_5]|nr:MAG: hypothetical protein A2Y38_00550 [Spirochaetes bacterium GWB1_59_5]